ncbi:MAG: hypothetical protein H7Z39_16355 [Burkholderiaceae bacterium]|nr:hypothetical protein [Burkholderiaceae bacterium]
MSFPSFLGFHSSGDAATIHKCRARLRAKKENPAGGLDISQAPFFGQKRAGDAPPACCCDVQKRAGDSNVLNCQFHSTIFIKEPPMGISGIKQEVRVNLVGQTAKIEADYSIGHTSISIKTEIKMSAEKPLTVDQLRDAPIKLAIPVLETLIAKTDTTPSP